MRHAPLIQPSCITSCRHLSVGDGVNGKSSKENDIIESASATTQWKRNHYRKIEDKFHPPAPIKENENDAAEENCANAKSSSTQQTSDPLTIDEYEDVQPMWKNMESRVTKRRSLTLDQRGGVSGRRNVRKSEEDMWLEAGVYDSDKSKKE